MRLICVTLLCLSLWSSLKGVSVAAASNQLHLEGKHDQDNQVINCTVNHEFCMDNNKLLRSHIELLSNSFEEITHLVNECRNQQEKLKEFEAKEIEHQSELADKNYQIKQLQMEIEIYKSKDDLLAVVTRELRTEQGIIKQLPQNLCEKEKTELAQIKSQLSLEGDKLAKCNTKLGGNMNTLVEKDQEINKLQIELKKSVDKLKSWKPASCFAQDSSVTLSKCYTFDVLCNSDIAGPGWTVIQQRIRGGVDFYRDWDTYRKGFGDFWYGDFFLGLEKIHRLTAEQPHELYIHMEHRNGSTYFARYDEFAISGEDDQYTLRKLGKFNGSIGDELDWHKNNKFSTYDKDNDDSDIHCAVERHGGWWYNNCAVSHLNGIYYQSIEDNGQSIFWNPLISLKHVKMMIRPIAARK